MSRYRHSLVCKEDADEDVKNTHTHCLIWGDDMPSNEEDFAFLLKSKIGGCKGNGRFAICNTEKEFDRAVRYVCKGHKDTPPNIIVNTHALTQAEILDAWARYWHDKVILKKKEHEDTSMRLMNRLWENNKTEFEGLCGVFKNRYELFKYWHGKVMDAYVKELKTYDDDKFMAHVNGLMLQSDPEGFRIARWHKHCKMAGFSNAAVEAFIDDDTNVKE